MIYKNWPEPHETQEYKKIRKKCMLCSELVDIDQQKKVKHNFYLV